EDEIATHQTGRNSGVIHSGIYYKPDSIKALTCRSGKAQLEAFCTEHGVKWESCGKVIVALDSSEIPSMERIFERGKANGVACETIGKEELKEIEPHAAGIAALRVPETGIVDYVGFCNKLRELLIQSGHHVQCGFELNQWVEQPNGETLLMAPNNEVVVDFVINCAGLHSDRVASLAGLEPKIKIIPFRGEYYELTTEAEHLCKHLIYPVPDPNFPFLGVHFTRMVLGGVECGPNAVLAFAREGYSNSEINPRDLAESLTYGGFIKLAMKHWKMGAGEMHRSFSKKAFVKALSRLIPEIQESHLHAAPAGVRAQAIARDGSLVDDFVFEEGKASIHVINAVSPAATACLSIADAITELFARRNSLV
ncbi:MAG TPA: L-2-hydroxyglutarate oxidase, partial [Fimbriimonas sp.]|nr:L-2-hydroxyglutarate oxidase [Fimbriimonas sp.]